jgi:poly(A) polymerase
MTSIGADWLTNPQAQAACRMLTDAGYQALFVGGCVRNELLGAPITDIDLSTDAEPEMVIALAKKAGFKPVPTGIEHGTVTVVVEHHPFEITTFRKDIETDGRRAVVAYAKTAEEDAHRRDFTMNALFARPDGIIIDPLGGLADLTERRVRFIDDPEERIREDYLRILRFFRFHAWYGNPAAGLDADGLSAVSANLDGIETLSRERVGQELLKLLSAPDPGPSLAAMEACGVLARVLPGASATLLPVLIHLEDEAGAAPDAIRRLACIGGSNHQEQLRLSRKDTRRLTMLRDNSGKDTEPEELSYRLGYTGALDVILLNSASFENHLPANLAQMLELGAEARFPVKPRDLMPAFKGAALGERLKLLEKRWIESGFTLTRAELLS